MDNFTTKAEGPSYGVAEDAPSVRLYSYDAIAKGTEYPESYVLPDELLPTIKNQGNIGACCGCAAASILEVLNQLETDEKVEFSEGYIYGHNRTAVYQGMNPQSLVEIMKTYGSVPKEYFNRLYEQPEMTDNINNDPNKDKLEEIAKKYRINSYVGFLKGNKEDMKKAIYEYKLPLFAVSNYYFRESHAIMVIGYTKDSFIIQNSWGESWKDGGRGEVPLSAINYAYLLLDEVFDINFKDVPKDAWYYKAVKECVFNGFMKGTSEDTFEPNAPLTRAQAAQLVVNLAKKIDEIMDLRVQCQR